MSTGAPPMIRTRPTPRCLVCGASGTAVYEHLEDRLFGAPGSWRIARCPDAGCGLLWLDPAPWPEDLALAYATYYTHAPPGAGATLRTRLRRWAMEGYYSTRYGYPVSGAWAKRVLAALVVRGAGLREQLDRWVLMQPPRPGGRALDVGCGDGRTIATLVSLGWEAEGLDTDPVAVERARSRGVRATAGTLTPGRFTPGSFDVIGMSHVIEHLHEPRAVLEECRTLLRPGGRLVVITPNATSLGHRTFGRDWRGLEVPRHLQIFTGPALNRLLEQTGFTGVAVSSLAGGAAVLHAESRRIQGEHGARPGDASSRAFARAEARESQRDPWAGEELLAIAGG